MNTRSSTSTKRKRTDPEAGTSNTIDSSKKINQEPESENENENEDRVGDGGVKVDDQLTIKFEDGLKEEPKDFDAFNIDLRERQNLTSSGLIAKNTEVLKLWKEKAKELYKRNKPKMGRPKSLAKFPCSRCTKKFASERCQVCKYQLLPLFGYYN